MISHLTRKIKTLVLMVCLGCSVSTQAAPVYTVGAVPQFEAREMASIWIPILQELSKRTGLQFAMKGSPRIPEFEVAFQAGEFDFAYMNPYHAMIAEKAQGYIPLVKDSEPLYGVLAVRKDSPYTKVQDLSGKKISFPAPNSFGASLLMRADLDRTYHVKFTPLYSQTHTSAYLNTVLGVSDASGGVIASFNKQKPDIKDNLRILYETRKVASHPILAHPRVPAADRQKVQQALLDMGATPEGAQLLARIPMPKVTTASKADYSSLKDLKLEKYYVKSGD